MIKDAIDIMRFIVCPSCKKKTIDTYLIEQVRHQHKPTYSNLKTNIVDNQDGTVSNTKVSNIHLYLTCGNCKFMIKIINKEWLKIFHKHAFNI